jgi:BirA family biotin operon repressor/biotin-[acetyl-CoA-carboxylase] ligase
MRRAHAASLLGATLIAAAEQTAGRGRRGREWRSKLGDTLMWSLAYAVPAKLPLDGLSLALGVGIAEALNALLGAPTVQLKWPNDFLIASDAQVDTASFKKLAGMLVESVPYNRNRNGALVAERWLIIGFGMNLRMPAGDDALAQEATALHTAWTLPREVQRQELGSVTASACVASLGQFISEGFAAGFQARWQALHAHQGLRVRYTSGDGLSVEGMAQGVDASGALLIAPLDMKDNAAMHSVSLRIISTEGSLRLC